jgi:hypothetical protein
MIQIFQFVSILKLRRYKKNEITFFILGGFFKKILGD